MCNVGMAVGTLDISQPGAIMDVEKGGMEWIVQAQKRRYKRLGMPPVIYGGNWRPPLAA